MTELTDKEFEAILQLNSDYRKAMFLKSVNENNGLFVLVDDSCFVVSCGNINKSYKQRYFKRTA